MQRSAVRAVLTSAALLLVSACGGPPEPGADAEKAHAAWKLYRKRPATDTYYNFVFANRMAASAHAHPDDGVGVEYQCRALEAEAEQAERTADVSLADEVTDRVDEIERHELLGVYDEVLPGAKKRIEQAKAQAAKVAR